MDTAGAAPHITTDAHASVIERLATELRRALTGTIRNPGFSVIVLVTLALGIGAATAIFTMLDRVVLQPLPYPNPGQLVWLDSPTPGVGADQRWGLSVAEFFYFKKNAHSLENMGTYSSGLITVSGKQSAERVPSTSVSSSLFNVLGLHTILGRAILPEDNLRNAAPVVVLGYDYWKNHFNGDPSVIGSMIDIEARPTQIVGVMQQGATVPDATSQQVDLWAPDQVDPGLEAVNDHHLQVVARLAPGASIASAHAELASFIPRLPDLFPTAYSQSFLKQTGFTIAVTPLRTHVIGDIASRLWILLGAVVLVLVIACANIANLFLVRAEARHREVAIRSALGAKRVDLAWQYITESMLLTVIAGAVAVAIAYVGLRAMITLAPAGLPRVNEIHLDWTSVLFTLAISIAAGVAFGLLTLANAGKPTDDSTMLREGGRGLTSSRAQQFARGVFVAAQTALALVLLAAAGLMLQSFRNMRSVSPGFDPSGVLTADIHLPYGSYNSYAKVEAFDHELLTRAAAIPGVKSAGLGDRIPLGVPSNADQPLLSAFGGCAVVWIEGHPLAPGQQPPCVGTATAAPGYFRALGMKVTGREPSWSDVESLTGGVVVTRSLAQRLWPGQDAIGKGIRGNGEGPPYYRVVGVSDDFRGNALDQPPVQAVFFPLLPIPKAWLWSPSNDVTVILKSSGVRPEALTASLRRTITSIDPNVPMGNVRTMDAVVAQSMARLSFTMTLLAIAAAMALILSAVGIYGVISYIVGRRTGEIGIRMALGAQASRVGRLVVWQSVRLAMLGVIVGIVAALVMNRALRSVLFDVSPSDPVTLVAVSLIMLVIAAIASYAPAQRAMRVDPVEALRAD